MHYRVWVQFVVYQVIHPSIADIIRYQLWYIFGDFCERLRMLDTIPRSHDGDLSAKWLYLNTDSSGNYLTFKNFK